MRLSVRVPMFVWAAALLGLIVLLATLQYRWLGQISADERERMKATLSTRAAGLAHDFDREITRAYATFQVDRAPHEGDSLAARLADRYERWQTTSRYPRLVRDIYVVPGGEGHAQLQRFHPDSSFIEPVAWPSVLEPIRERIATPPPAPVEGAPAIRSMPPTLWEAIPAVLVPTPVLVFSGSTGVGWSSTQEVTLAPAMTYTILVFDGDYLREEMLPALTQQHFRATGDATDYLISVVDADDGARVYSQPDRALADAQAPADVETPLFQVRLQDFGPMVSEVRRFTSIISRPEEHARPGSGPSAPLDTRLRMMLPADVAGKLSGRDSGSFSVVVQQGTTASERRSIESAAAAATAAVASRPATPGRWRLRITHPSGSLEAAVTNARRRNLLVSSGILAVLGVSIGFLVVSTRRAQELARQQMEFVAAVSHELRTPLAVIRSAADNLAEGVVRGEPQVRKYGELMRGEGRRLSEMVEQILELAGIHSGQRGFALRPVAVVPLLHEVVRASETLSAEAGIEVEFDIQDGLPPVLGEEQALRRVFGNLLGNAIKYGAEGRWIGIRARGTGREVHVTVADRGMGIDPVEQSHVFEPFYRAPRVVAAQIQGAGLGLSLVHRIVEAHAGKITLRSAPGEGSEFTVHLPAAAEEAVSRPVSSPDAAPSHTAT